MAHLVQDAPPLSPTSAPLISSLLSRAFKRRLCLHHAVGRTFEKIEIVPPTWSNSCRPHVQLHASDGVCVYVCGCACALFFDRNFRPSMERHFCHEKNCCRLEFSLWKFPYPLDLGKPLGSCTFPTVEGKVSVNE